tara:strand:- start:2180 stop:3310 length:1131 start_codon:yes stop_codon:yes gene_type:complete
MKKLLVDAISTNSGGAISHLKNLLINFNKQKYFDEIDVFLPSSTKKLMPVKKGINYYAPKVLSKNLLLRIFWQTFILNLIIKKKKYNCIFVTGSSHFLLAKPIVTISQNLLPFSKNEVDKYFFSIFYLKMKILKIIQTISFKMSEGVIFLHKYSQQKIISQIGKIKGLVKVIPHGISFEKKKYILKKNKFRLIYVSNIDLYKNQTFLVKSIDNFLTKFPSFKTKIKVEFYGSAYKPALKKFNKVLDLSRNRKNFKYFGIKKGKYIYNHRKNLDTIFLFASSCENFSVSLLEGMSKGYPILCVNLQPMKSVLGKAALFYEYGSVISFQNQLKKLISSKKIQNKLSKIVYKRSKMFIDNSIAKKTFDFLIKISKKYEN